MYEFLSWLTLMLLAQWFFGNLYEAVVFVPNLMPFFELTSQSGEALFKSKKRSPIVYYVPGGLLAVVLAPTLAAISLGEGRPGTAYIFASCGLLFVGLGITFYVVRGINLDLFFKPQSDLNRTRKLLHAWTVLNYVRLTVAAASLIAAILWIRLSIRS
jgi:hypothetical protein